METIIGIAAGIFTSIAMVPQLIKVLKEKKVDDISGGTLIVLIIGLILWIGYGILKNEWPIIVSNAFALVVNTYLGICLIRYKNRN